MRCMAGPRAVQSCMHQPAKWGKGELEPVRVDPMTVTARGGCVCDDMWEKGQASYKHACATRRDSQ